MQGGMDFRDLEVFITVGKLQSFSRAAAHLRCAQSALSRRVRRLEHLFGTPLLERHGRDVRLTETGLILLPARVRLCATNYAIYGSR